MGTRRVSGTDIVSGMDLRISVGSTPNFQLFQFHSFRFSLKQINQSIARNFKSKFRIWRNSVEWTQHYSGWTAQRGTLSAWQTDSRLTPSSMPVPSPCRTLERFPRRGTSMFTSAHWSPSPTLYVRLLLHPRQYSHQMGLFIKISLRLLILRSAMHKMKNSRICEESQKAFDHGYSKWAWHQACGPNGTSGTEPERWSYWSLERTNSQPFDLKVFLCHNTQEVKTQTIDDIACIS